MNIKSVPIVLVIVFLVSLSVPAVLVGRDLEGRDHVAWKDQLSMYLTGVPADGVVSDSSFQPDYLAAQKYLETQFPKMLPHEADRSFVLLALAFLAQKNRRPQVEEARLRDLFETYKGMVDVFPIPGSPVSRELGEYWRRWRLAYPVVRRCGLVRDFQFQGSQVPSGLVLGLDVNLNVPFRLIQGDEVLRIGQLDVGFNKIPVPVDGMLFRSGEHRLALELKAGQMVVVKEFIITVISDYPQDSGQVNHLVREAGYGVAMFVENRLVAYHKRKVRLPKKKSYIERERERVKMDRLSTRGPDPFDPTGELAAQKMSLPVLLLPALAYKHIIKPKLTKKKKPEIKTYTELSGTFLTNGPSGEDMPIDVTLIFKEAETR